MLKMINFLYWLYLFLTLIKAVTGEYYCFATEIFYNI